MPKRKPLTRRKPRKASGPTWLAWWPLLAGVAITPLTLKAATLSALTGPAALRLLYPYTLIPGLISSGHMANIFAQALMYLQFPAYGLIAALILRKRSFTAALLTVIALHTIAATAVFLLA